MICPLIEFFLHDTIKGFTGSDRLGMPDGEVVDQKVMQIMEIFTSLRDGNRPHRIVGQPLVTANDVGH